MNHEQHNAPSLASSPANVASIAPVLSRSAVMWWDGGERAITAREKALIEEHRPSCFTIPLLPAEAVDPTDPWRGLYLPTRMPSPSEYGDLSHPDIPRWPDDREDALDKLVHAQGFDFHIVAGDFTEAALEDGDELYWQEMLAWNPEAPEGEWRLAWKGDREDGPYAWFVRPMALRPEAVAPPAQGIDLGQQWPLIARALAEWHEDDGNVMWWAWCGRSWAGEPGWCGTPNDSDWPGYHTHWTQHPDQPSLIDGRDAGTGVDRG